MYYPSSETKGADQLCSYCTADLRLCFRIVQNPLSSWCGSFVEGQDRTQQFKIEILMDSELISIEKSMPG